MATDRAPGGWLTPSNLLSALRVPLAAAFAAGGGTEFRTAVLAAAGLSDVLDGWLARRTRSVSRVGELVDPATDRVFAFVTLATLLRVGAIGVPAFLVLLSRDIFTAAMFGLARAAGIPLRGAARRGGKWVTLLQYATVFAVLLRPEAVAPLVALTGAASAYAVFDYTRANLPAVRRSPEL